MKLPEHSPSTMDKGIDPVPLSRLWYGVRGLHRRHGPAVELPNGRKQWMLHGECHRSDGPAVEAPSGEMGWYLNGQYHILPIPGVDRLYTEMEMSRFAAEEDLLPKILALANYIK